MGYSSTQPKYQRTVQNRPLNYSIYIGVPLNLSNTDFGCREFLPISVHPTWPFKKPLLKGLLLFPLFHISVKWICITLLYRAPPIDATPLYIPF